MQVDQGLCTWHTCFDRPGLMLTLKPYCAHGRMRPGLFLHFSQSPLGCFSLNYRKRPGHALPCAQQGFSVNIKSGHLNQLCSVWSPSFGLISCSLHANIEASSPQPCTLTGTTSLEHLCLCSLGLVVSVSLWLASSSCRYSRLATEQLRP